MKIKDIKSIRTNKTRTDGRYPMRIGCTVEFDTKPREGMPLWLAYVSDKMGNPKSGYLRTNLVCNIIETDTEIIIATLNSIYYFER